MVIRHEPRSVMGRDYTHVRGHLLQDFLTLVCIFLLAHQVPVSGGSHTFSHSQFPITARVTAGPSPRFLVCRNSVNTPCALPPRRQSEHFQSLFLPLHTKTPNTLNI